MSGAQRVNGDGQEPKKITKTDPFSETDPHREGVPTEGIETANPKEAQIQAWGLIVRGRIERRIRRVIGENHTEVVTYTLGPRVAQVVEWAPDRYFSIGETVELPVEISGYNGRAVLRFSEEDEF